MFANHIRLEMTKEEYLEQLLSEIEQKKVDGKKGIYRIGIQLNPDIAKYVKEYFASKINYTIDVHSCSGCRSSIWDIIILFKG